MDERLEAVTAQEAVEEKYGHLASPIPAVRYGFQARAVRAIALAELAGLAGGPPAPTFVDRLKMAHLNNLILDLDAALAGACPERPEEQRGRSMGMYHCPTCGCMVVAGVDRHGHDRDCWLGLGVDRTQVDDGELDDPSPVTEILWYFMHDHGHVETHSHSIVNYHNGSIPNRDHVGVPIATFDECRAQWRAAPSEGSV